MFITIAISEISSGNIFAYDLPQRCDTTNWRFDLGEILTCFFLADCKFCKSIFQARKEACEGKYLVHKDIFGND